MHRLYQRTSADLSRVATYVSDTSLCDYLEGLVGRAYAEIHETRRKPHRLRPWFWFTNSFPLAVRSHRLALAVSLSAMIVGSLFGSGALLLDPAAKTVLIPFGHLAGDPSERVKNEQSANEDRLEGRKAGFSSMLIQNNTTVSITTMALGITYGLGTLVVLFYNGVILGAVATDYIAAGEIRFLAGWLLPHGSVEIPAIILAGQAGLVLGFVLIGRGTRYPLGVRFRRSAADLANLIGGVAVLLVWAGLIEAFISQYHEPLLPYAVKITFGIIELVLLFYFLLIRKLSDAPD